MAYLRLSIILLWSFCVSMNVALQINLYTSIGQIKQEVSISDGYFEMYLTKEEHTAMIPGSINFPGEKILEQDLFGSDERLRNTNVYIRSAKCGNTAPIQSKILDPYSLLIKSDSSRYFYVSRDQIQFQRDPPINGMILSVRLDNRAITKTNLSYLTSGLRWAPRYEVNIINEKSATLRGLADIHNDHQRSYDITHSQLITGDVPLVTSSPTFQKANFYPSYNAASQSDFISTTPDATNFGTYSYNITRQFKLYPKSIKSYPFLTPTIVFNYTLEGTTYLTEGTNSALFRRVFTLQASEFLPAGIATFYLNQTGTCLGQGRLIDTAKNTEQKVTVGTDSDVKYTIKSTTTSTRNTSPFGRDITANVVIANLKTKQIVTVTLTINSGYGNTTLTMQNKSSSSITITQDPTLKSTLIIRAVIKATHAESCSFTLKQSN